jgi:hypothetical protein
MFVRELSNITEITFIGESMNLTEVMFIRELKNIIFLFFLPILSTSLAGWKASKIGIKKLQYTHI